MTPPDHQSKRQRMTAGAGVNILQAIYDRLWSAYGPQHWWPARTPTEVAVGAILTQNTAWGNVERALGNLKRAGCLRWPKLRDLPEARLAELIRPAGTYRVKAARLKAFVRVLFDEHGGSLAALLDGGVDDARARLLGIYGIGRETADALLLYVGQRATFVVDVYTRRILRRHFVIEPGATYEDVRRRFHEAIGPDPAVYNEYHALLVELGKRHCRVRARCPDCPLANLPHDADL